MKTFIESELGATTVDWVVLTASLVGLGLATMAVVSTGVQDVATDTEAQLSGTIITTSFADAAPYAWSGYTPNAWSESDFANSVSTYSGSNGDSLRSQAQTWATTLQGRVDQGHDMSDSSTATYADIVAVRLTNLEALGEPMPDNYDEIIATMEAAGAIPAQ